MKSQTSLVAQQVRLSEWAEQIRECQNRPKGMKVDEWCSQQGITKANYYWRLRRVREAFLETNALSPSFVEIPKSHFCCYENRGCIKRQESLIFRNNRSGVTDIFKYSIRGSASC